MVNPKGVDFSEVQSGNWNVAKPYTSEKILKWLVAIDDYQTIATFGYKNIESDVFIKDTNLKNTSRIHALRRLIHALITLIRNTRFALKKKNHKTDFDTYKERLSKIEKHLHKLRLEKKRGNKVIELNINENLFDKMMEEITKIIDDINFRLNHSDLIFTYVEEYDPKKIKEALKEKYINRG